MNEETIDELAEKRRKALQRVIDEVIEKEKGESLNWWAKSAGASMSGITKFLYGGSKTLNEHTYFKLAKFLGVSISYLKGEVDSSLTKVIPIVGYFGAGDQLFPFDDQVIEYIELPFLVPGKNLRGGIVRGDSMYPEFHNGELIVFTNEYDFAEEKCLNSYCVLKVKDGPTYIKQIIKGSRPGKYTLISENGLPIVDVEIECAYPVVCKFYKMSYKSLNTDPGPDKS